MHHAVESSGGSVLLRDTPGSQTDNSLVSKDTCVMMMDSKEQNAIPTDSQKWVLHVMETLRRFVLVCHFIAHEFSVVKVLYFLF